MIVWYLNHYATLPESGMPGRPYNLSRAFLASGHAAVVFHASFHHLSPVPSPPVDLNRISFHEGVSYYSIPTRSYRGKGLGRFLNMRDYARGIARLRKEVSAGRLAKPDIIIPSSPHIFSYPPASRLADRFGAGLVFEVRDLWPLSLIDVIHVHPWHPAILWMSHIEKRAYQTAEAVVSLVPRAIDYMKQRGLDERRFLYIPNGVSAEEWTAPPAPLPPEHQTVFNQIKNTGKLLIVYAGAHGPPNALDQVLDLRRIDGSARPYHFILIGDGVNKVALQTRVRDEKIDFVTFLPRMNKAGVRSCLRQADVCFIGWKKRAIYRFGISPNKIGDYFMTGKPVLHAVRAGNNPVAEAGAGISVEPYNPVQLDRALRMFVAMNVEEREEMGRRGRKYAREKLEWSVLGRRYIELCEKIVSQKKRAEPS